MAAALSVAALTAGGAAASQAQNRAAARQLLADGAMVDSASARFQSIALGWLDNPTVTARQATSAASPLISAITSVEGRLRHQRWPTADRTDVGRLVTSFEGLVHTLHSLSHANFAKPVTWEAPLLRDQQRTVAAANRIRHDLGLKPLSGL